MPVLALVGVAFWNKRVGAQDGGAAARKSDGVPLLEGDSADGVSEYNY